jgi:hypothetical protein
MSAKLSLVTEQEKAEARAKGLVIVGGKPYDPDEYELDAMHYGITHAAEIVARRKARMAARAKQDAEKQ